MRDPMPIMPQAAPEAHNPQLLIRSILDGALAGFGTRLCKNGHDS
jgi:hypothetical protein